MHDCLISHADRLAQVPQHVRMQVLLLMSWTVPATAQHFSPTSHSDYTMTEEHAALMCIPGDVCSKLCWQALSNFCSAAEAQTNQECMIEHSLPARP